MAVKSYVINFYLNVETSHVLSLYVSCLVVMGVLKLLGIN